MKHTWRSVPVLLLILCLLAFSVACGSKTPDKSGGGLFAATDDANKSGLAGLLAAPTPEPTPVPLPVQFQAGLEKVLKDAVAKSEDIGDAGLGFLLKPEGGEDEKSYRSQTVIGIKQDGNEEQTVKTVTLLDKNTGDASFTIAAVEGAETAGEGGMYFTGGTMLFKRADASAPFIRFLPDAALVASYQNQTALFRAALALSEKQKPVQSEEEWGERIASFSSLVLAQSAQSDYAEGTAELSLPGVGSGADTITLTLGGEAARTVLTEYVALLSDNGGISGMLNAIETKGQQETGVKRLAALQSSIQDSVDLSLTAALILYEDDPIGVDLAFTLDGEQNAWRLLFYEKGFERRNELSFLFGDGAKMTMLDTNENTGGDSYAGEVIMESAQPNGEGASVTFQSDSTNTDALYDMTGTLTFTQAKLDDGSLDTQSGDVSVTWKQQRNASGGVDATGSVVVTSDGDTLNVSIQYGKTFGDVSVDAPKFIESAGVSAASREDVFGELDIDTEEFDALPSAYRGLMLLMALTNG
jgi:hypothetical protein